MPAKKKPKENPSVDMDKIAELFSDMAQRIEKQQEQIDSVIKIRDQKNRDLTIRDQMPVQTVEQVQALQEQGKKPEVDLTQGLFSKKLDQATVGEMIEGAKVYVDWKKSEQPPVMTETDRIFRDMSVEALKDFMRVKTGIQARKEAPQT